MLIIGLFTKYFLILMIIQGLVVGFMDVKAFNRFNMKDTAKKARIIGLGSIGVGIILYAIRAFT